jgi:hypothetical protein
VDPCTTATCLDEVLDRAEGGMQIDELDRIAWTARHRPNSVAGAPRFHDPKDTQTAEPDFVAAIHADKSDVDESELGTISQTKAAEQELQAPLWPPLPSMRPARVKLWQCATSWQAHNSVRVSPDM